ncbi:MAG TPA: hypothetical protein VHC47_14585 [Mucilaginibacter sp.]|nr:hypothetical protein [Mucilaginibacter sp.]
MGLSFIIIENAELDYVVAEKLIRREIGDADIQTFLSANDAMKDIQAGAVKGSKPAIVLLDVMMPKYDGSWFVNAFEKLEESIQKDYFVVVLTSCMNQTELERLNSKKTVRMLFAKPINTEKLRAIVGEAKLEFGAE